MEESDVGLVRLGGCHAGADEARAGKKKVKSPEVKFKEAFWFARARAEGCLSQEVAQQEPCI